MCSSAYASIGAVIKMKEHDIVLESRLKSIASSFSRAKRSPRNKMKGHQAESFWLSVLAIEKFVIF